jgi:protein required for attachment to host cells
MGLGTWVLVSDAARARVLVERGTSGGLVELEEYACPGSREHVKDQVCDRAGLKPPGGKGARAGMVPVLDPKEVEARKFGRQLAEVLKQRLNGHAFKDLVLAAPPHFLGILRGSLDEAVARCVVASLDKDFTRLTPRELEARLMVRTR